MPENRETSFVALLLAAGEGKRLETARPKPWVEIFGRSLAGWSARRLAALEGRVATFVAIDPALVELGGVGEVFDTIDRVRIVAGGATRQESCKLAYDAARGLAFDLVLVHDAARPFVPLAETREALALAGEHGGAILGRRARDTVQRVDARGRLVETLDRDGVFLAATPQCFRRDAFEATLAHAEAEGLAGTDEASLARSAGVDVRTVATASLNLKITEPGDLALLPCLGDELRAGLGDDRDADG